MFGLLRRKKRADLNDKEWKVVETWALAKGLNWGNANYSVYRGKPLTAADDAACVLGVTADLNGDYSGFVLEVNDVSVKRGMKVPPSLASRGRELEFHSKAGGKPMAEIAILAEEKRLREVTK